MEKLAFINAHLLDPTQKISKVDEPPTIYEKERSHESQVFSQPLEHCTGNFHTATSLMIPDCYSDLTPDRAKCVALL